MPKPSSFLDYQLGIFSQFFARNANYQAIRLTRSDLILTTKHGKSNVISYMEITDEIVLSIGYFWGELAIALFDGSKIIIGGISKNKINMIRRALSQLSNRHQQHYFSSIQPKIIKAFEQVAPLLKQNSYIRQHHIVHWLQQYGDLVPGIEHQAIEQFLMPQQISQLNVVKPLLMHGKSMFDRYNKAFVEKELLQFKSFFDTVENQPLTQNQREACVINEQSNLVLAGAGTGKTSTMVGRAGYLIHAGLAQPDQILMLAFASDAAKEMVERIDNKLDVKGLTAKTFHSLGNEIIAAVEGNVPAINKIAQDEHLKTRFVDDQFKQLMLDSEYQARLVTYFVRFAYPYKSPFNFKNLEQYNHYIRTNDIRTLQGELVKSYEECEIANFLFQQGISYEYEANYEVNTSGPDFRAYQPDFYLPDYAIYIEHFGVDENNHTPPFIDQDKYIEGMCWKRELHKKYNTILIETFSYQKRQGILTQSLKEALIEAGVEFNPVPNDELLTTLKKFGQVSTFSRLLSQLLTLLKSALLSMQQFVSKAQQHGDKERMLAAAKLFEPIYAAYQQHLKNTATIDFDDMIGKAITYIESKQYQSPFTHILVDEFQDISASRARLIKALLAQHSDSTLFCVGDDWQAIYQFTGSDISITRDFEQHFGHVATSVLDQTFRFNNKIGDVAAQFITQNPAQIDKEIGSFHQTNNSAVSLLKTSNNQTGISAALSLIHNKADSSASVLILVRFKHDLPCLNQLKNSFPKLRIKTMTAHASKGKEADYVIILGLQKGEFGFPSEKTTHPLLAMLLPKAEPYAYAEERRLFYVALTRAKHHVYLITDADKASIFVRELIKDNYDVIEEQPAGYEFQSKIADIPCSRCKTGYMVARTGEFGRFYGCSDYPLCKNKQSACKWCGGGLKERGDIRACENTNCDYVEPICPKCQGAMLKKGQNGTFWGCSNYRRDSQFSCRYTKKFIDLKSSNK